MSVHIHDWKDALIKSTCLCAPDSEYACAARRERCLDSVERALDELAVVPSAAPTAAPTAQPQPLPRATARYRR